MLPTLLLLAAAPNDLLVASSFQPAGLQVFEVPSSSLVRVIGPGTTLSGTLGSTVGPDGLLYVASETSNEVLRFEPWTGVFRGAFVTDDPNTSVDETGGLNGPSGVVFGPDGRLYVGSFNGDQVLAYDGKSGAFDGVFVVTDAANLNGPDAGMVFGPDGHLYVPSYFNRRVKRFDGVTGDFIGNFLRPGTSGLLNPRGVFFVGDGTVLATSEGTDQVLRFDATTGAYIDVLIGDDPSTSIDESGGLDGPTGIVRTPDGDWWVASVNTDEVKRYAADGTYLDSPIGPGVGGLATPTHLTLLPHASPVCSGAPNAVGPGATLVARGSTRIPVNDFRLEMRSAPAQALVVFVQGAGAPPVPLGNGTLCLGGALYRLAALQTDADGAADWRVDLTAPPVPGAAIAVGASWDFQCVFREPGGAGFNTSGSLRALFGS